MPLGVRVHHLPVLGDLHVTGSGKTPRDLPGVVHDRPPLLTADSAGRIRRARTAARSAMRGQRPDRRLEPFPDRPVRQGGCGGLVAVLGGSAQFGLQLLTHAPSQGVGPRAVKEAQARGR